MDGLRVAVPSVVVVAVAAAACSSGGGRPVRLLDGRPAAQFRPVDGGVLAAGRVLRRSDLEGRVDACLLPGDRPSVSADALVVERVGIDGESITFANRTGTGIYACDGGVDASGERQAPWCGTVFGELVNGRLLDGRLDVLCSDRERRPLAYVFVGPVEAARWVGVRQDGHIELYEVLGGLPVRVASTSGVDAPNARATFQITEYDAAGRPLLAETLAASVAG